MLGKAGTLGMLAIAVGCSGSDVSAGTEGDGVNLDRCFDVTCRSQAEGLIAEAPRPQSCAETGAELSDDFWFEELPQTDVLKVVASADGSVWAVTRGRITLDSAQDIRLAHFSASGALQKQSNVLLTEGAEYTQSEYALALDDTGHVTLSVYWTYAPTADSEVQERVTLYRSDSELEEIEKSEFHSVGSVRLAGGPGGELWLAGNAAGFQAHGVVARIANGRAAWVQTAVPSIGQSVLGVSGLTVAADGTSAVLAQLASRWDGTGDNVYSWGVSTFGADGAPSWELQLPNAFAAGVAAGLVGTAAGGLVAAGAASHETESRTGSLLLQGISKDGHITWAYEADGSNVTFDGVVELLPSERALVGLRGSVVVVDADGSACQRFLLPNVGPWQYAPRTPEEEPAHGSAPFVPGADYVYAPGGGHIVRLRVPE